MKILIEFPIEFKVEKGFSRGIAWTAEPGWYEATKNGRGDYVIRNGDKTGYVFGQEVVDEISHHDARAA